MSAIHVTKCYHDFCPQCPAVDTWLPQLCAEEGIKPEYLDVIKNNSKATQMQVTTVPTVIVQRDGELPVLLFGPDLTSKKVRAIIQKLKE